MIQVEEAREILARAVLGLEAVERPLAQAAGSVLARSFRADRDLPPFDRAAVDGYAVRLAGPWMDEAEFRVLGVLAAGQSWRGALAPGTAVKVMTGAPVPRGADGVVMVEQSEPLDGGRVRLSGPFPTEEGRPGIAPRGQDALRGAVVLEKGTLLGAPQIAVAASIGAAEVPVYRKRTLAVITTGDETVPVGERPGPAQIRNSNGPMLVTLLSPICASIAVSKARDGLEPARRAIRRAAARAEVLVLTGGVSAGDFDCVPGALEAEGFRIRFHKVALRPGRPLLFAVSGTGRNRKVAFGLPGNPVSVLVTAWEFVFPYLRASSGWPQPGPWEWTGRAAEAIARKPGLQHYVPAVAGFRDGTLEVRPVSSHGSGDFVSAGRADALIVLPAESPRVELGSECRVHPLPGMLGCVLPGNLLERRRP